MALVAEVMVETAIVRDDIWAEEGVVEVEVEVRDMGDTAPVAPAATPNPQIETSNRNRSASFHSWLMDYLRRGGVNIDLN